MTDRTSSVQHAPISTIDTVTHGVVLRDHQAPRITQRGGSVGVAVWVVEFGKVLLNFADRGRALANCERDGFDGTAANVTSCDDSSTSKPERAARVWSARWGPKPLAAAWWKADARVALT